MVTYLIRGTARIQAQDCLIPEPLLLITTPGCLSLSRVARAHRVTSTSGSLSCFLPFLFFLLLSILLQSVVLLPQIPFSPFSSFPSLPHWGIVALSQSLPSQISPCRAPSRTIPRRNKWGIYSSFSPPGPTALSPDRNR